MFVPLHVKSDYSLGYGTASPDMEGGFFENGMEPSGRVSEILCLLKENTDFAVLFLQFFLRIMQK